MDTRASREQAYWDRAYRVTEPEHAKCVWARRNEGGAYIGAYLEGLLRDLRDKRILSLGGGVDYLGVRLAQAGNHVVTADVSSVASAATAELARQTGTADRVVALLGAAEDLAFDRESFDLVICKRSLHHMDLNRVVPRVWEALCPGGLFLAEEPVCLLRPLQWIHRTFPFAPEAPRTQDERELTGEDLNFITNIFTNMSIYYFDVLARESIAYFLHRWRLGGLLRPLGKLDYFLSNHCFPPLSYLGSYVIIRATK